MKNEVWRDIPEYEGLYQVSNLGRVKNLNNFHTKMEKILKPTLHPKGYLRVALFKNRKPKFFSVHRLVAVSFIENPENKDCINHIDCNKQNNEVDNLEWVTTQENQTHAINNGLYKVLDNHPRTNLTLEQVTEIRDLLSQNKSPKEVAMLFNVKRSCIYDIKLGRTWNF